MTSEPASSSRPAIIRTTNWPWWTKNFRSSRGAKRHERAIAARRLIDASKSAPEGDVRGLDGVEQQGGVSPTVLHVHEGGIALELGQPERAVRGVPTMRLEQVAGDDRRVLDLAAREVRGVARQVGD